MTYVLVMFADQVVVEGFSRGAYQIRVLAGMLEKVRLLY